MSWESPINLITNYTDELVKNLEAAQEECVMRAVANVGVYVEKDELLKALAYDRDQYTIGWHDGYNDRDKEIIRCRECKHCGLLLSEEEKEDSFVDLVCDYWESDGLSPNSYCSFAERKENG